MKRFTTLVVCGLVFTLAVTGAAKKPRKLPMKAYITGAKISGGFTGETPNSDAALALLDTCLMFYGMVPEAYFWQVSILSELAEEIPSNDTAKLIEGLTRFKTTYDSLVLSCDEEFKEVKIKKKLRKKCSDFRATADSLHHERYAEYFNRAQESRNLVLDTLVKELEELTNEEDIADMKEEIKVAIAEAIANYDIASILKPDDASIAINMGDIYSSQRQYDKALKYQRHAAEITKERDPGNYPAMLNQVAYSYYELKEFEKSADVFKEIAELVEGEQRIMQYRNVVACYSSVSQADSVFVYNYKVLEIDPNDAKSLSNLGGMWFNKIQNLNMEHSKARDAKDKQLEKKLTAELKRASDSASHYLKRAFEADPADANSIEFYAITHTLAGNMEESAAAWEMLTQLAPQEKRFWLHLGENYIRLGKFKEAITPFEKLAELDATDPAVWERLVELYKNNGMSDKAKRASSKLAELSKS